MAGKGAENPHSTRPSRIDSSREARLADPNARLPFIEPDGRISRNRLSGAVLRFAS